jgi:hypothetical protein
MLAVRKLAYPDRWGAGKGQVFLLGGLMVLGGIGAFYIAQSAIHEILGTLGIGFGLLIIALGLIALRLSSIVDELAKLNAIQSAAPEKTAAAILQVSRRERKRQAADGEAASATAAAELDRKARARGRGLRGRELG